MFIDRAIIKNGKLRRSGISFPAQHCAPTELGSRAAVSAINISLLAER